MLLGSIDKTVHLACNIYMYFIGGHLGRDKTIKEIEARFYWKEMNGDIREYVRRCDKCQRTNAKLPKSNSTLHPIRVEPAVWHQVSYSNNNDESFLTIH